MVQIRIKINPGDLEKDIGTYPPKNSILEIMTENDTSLCSELNSIHKKSTPRIRFRGKQP
jgi:hypothetical protein